MSDYQSQISDADWIGEDTPHETTSQPKPCPFCGSAAMVVGPRDTGPYFVMCIGYCATVMGQLYCRNGLPAHKFKTIKEAEEAWDKRINQ